MCEKVSANFVFFNVARSIGWSDFFTVYYF